VNEEGHPTCLEGSKFKTDKIIIFYRGVSFG
jgi:hypothetical protein